MHGSCGFDQVLSALQSLLQLQASMPNNLSMPILLQERERVFNRLAVRARGRAAKALRGMLVLIRFGFSRVRVEIGEDGWVHVHMGWMCAATSGHWQRATGADWALLEAQRSTVRANERAMADLRWDAAEVSLVVATIAKLAHVWEGFVLTQLSPT